METKALAKKGLDVLKKNNTTIMFGTGLITLGVGVFFLVKKTIESHDVLANNTLEEIEIDEDGNETGVSKTVERTIMDTLKLIGKTYWIPGVMIVSGTGLLIASHVMQCSKSASAMMAAGMAATSLNEWKSKATEVLGDKNMQKVTDAIAKDKAEALSDEDLTPPWDKNAGGEFKTYEDERHKVYTDENDEIQCTDIVAYEENRCCVMDGLTGQTAWVSRSDIDELNLRFGEMMLSGEDVTLNDYLYEIHAKNVPCEFGDRMGWPAYGNRIHMRLSKCLDERGKHFVYIDHDVAPMPLYTR